MTWSVEHHTCYGRVAKTVDVLVHPAPQSMNRPAAYLSEHVLIPPVVRQGWPRLYSLPNVWESHVIHRSAAMTNSHATTMCVIDPHMCRLKTQPHKVAQAMTVRMSQTETCAVYLAKPVITSYVHQKGMSVWSLIQARHFVQETCAKHLMLPCAVCRGQHVTPLLVRLEQ